jgi:hypothetical protein
LFFFLFTPTLFCFRLGAFFFGYLALPCFFIQAFLLFTRLGQTLLFFAALLLRCFTLFLRVLQFLFFRETLFFLFQFLFFQ